MARRWAPELVIVDADEAITAEDAGKRTGYVDSFRRRHGRMPWEPEPLREIAADFDSAAAPNRCIGLKGLQGDDVNYKNLEEKNLESSPGSVKADATWAPCAELDLDRTVGSPDKSDVRLMAAYGRALGLPTLDREELEQPVKTGALHDSDVIRRRGSDGEARKLVQAALDPLPWEKEHPVLEHGRCRHPLASLMAIAMVLDDVVLVECVAGCGHRLYSDRGPWECPCHWPAAKAARAARELLRDRAKTAPAE